MAIKRHYDPVMVQYISGKIEAIITQNINAKDVADQIAKEMVVTIDQAVETLIAQRTKKKSKE